MSTTTPPRERPRQAAGPATEAQHQPAAKSRHSQRSGWPGSSWPPPSSAWACSPSIPDRGLRGSLFCCNIIRRRPLLGFRTTSPEWSRTRPPSRGVVFLNTYRVWLWPSRVGLALALAMMVQESTPAWPRRTLARPLFPVVRGLGVHLHAVSLQPAFSSAWSTGSTVPRWASRGALAHHAGGGSAAVRAAELRVLLPVVHRRPRLHLRGNLRSGIDRRAGAHWLVQAPGGNYTWRPRRRPSSVPCRCSAETCAGHFTLHRRHGDLWNRRSNASSSVRRAVGVLLTLYHGHGCVVPAQQTIRLGPVRPAMTTTTGHGLAGHHPAFGRPLFANRGIQWNFAVRIVLL